MSSKRQAQATQPILQTAWMRDDWSDKRRIEQNMREAIEFHLEELRLEGYEIPEPHSSSAYIYVPAYLYEYT